LLINPKATTNSHGVVQYKGFLHTLAKIYKDEGFRGLYKGNIHWNIEISYFPGYGAAAVTIPIFHSLYFAIFYRTKDYLNNERIYNNRPVVRDMLASLYTGVVCNTLTNPLWVVRTRIQSQFLHREDTAPKYVGLMSGLRNLVKEVRIKKSLLIILSGRI